VVGESISWPNGLPLNNTNAAPPYRCTRLRFSSTRRRGCHGLDGFDAPPAQITAAAVTFAGRAIRTRFLGGGVRSCLHVKSDSVHSCTETFSIFQEILRAKPDAGALMHPDTCPGFCCRRTCRSGPSLFSGKILRLREPDVERICRGSWFCLLHGSSHPGNEPYTGISAIVHPTLSGQTSFRLNDRLSIGSRKGVRKKTCRRYDASEGAYACPRGTQGTARVAHLNASIEEQSLDRSRRR
jgi:hypothetical protein